jgi:hypothetical protein
VPSRSLTEPQARAQDLRRHIGTFRSPDAPRFAF